MTPLRWTMTHRYLMRHRWQTVLSVVGIALGVAVVVAVDLANESARRAFELSVETLTGGATHQIVGGATGFDESVYTRLRVERGMRQSAPVVEGFAEVGDETLRLLGVDPLAERGFRPEFGQTGPGVARRLMLDPATVLLSVATARRLHVQAGDRLSLEVGGRAVDVTVAGLLGAGGGSLRGNADLLVADVATAQELLGRIGRLDRIDLRLPAGHEAAALRDLRRWLPPGLRIVSAAARSQSMLQLTRAFRINLTAMSLLALLVGAFLIYNTMIFSVLRRRSLLGMLRVIGVTRRELFFLVLAEALVIGAVGTLVGLATGYALGQGLVRLVTRTINDLYFVLTVTDFLISPWSFAKGTALGLAATVLAASVPAREAAWATPQAAQRRSVVEARSRRQLGSGWLLASLLITAAVGLLLLPGGSLITGFAGLFLLVLGFTALTPAAVFWLSRFFSGPAALFGVLGRLAARGVSASLSRSGVAIAALTVAVAATVGMGIMVESFRGTVAHWLTQTLQGDLYVGAPGATSTRVDGTLDPGVLARLRHVEGIAAVSTARRVEMESSDGPVAVTALQMAPRTSQGFMLKAGNPSRLWPAFQRGEVVLVSEAYAYRRATRVGDSVTLLGRDGMHSLPIGGVYYDYGSEGGRVLMSRALYRRLSSDPYVSSAGLYLRPGVPAERVEAAIRGALAGVSQRLLIRSNREIHKRSLEIFDRTFVITRVLRLLVVAVAFVGILSALMALQLERAREHAVLRASGVTPGGLFAMVGGQTGLMGLMAGLLSLPLGLMIAAVLIQVINRRAFGWSLQITVSPPVLWQALALSVAAALVAGIYPALRMARTPPAEALREE